MVDYKICWVIEALIVLSCLNSFYGRKLQLNINVIIFIIADVVLMQVIKYGIVPRYAGILIYMMLAAYCWFNFIGTSIKALIINMCLTFILLGCIEIVCTMAVAYIFTSIVSEEVMALIICLLMSCIYFIVSKLVTLKRISEIMQRPDIVLICVLVIGTIVVVSCIFMTKMFEGMHFGEYIFSIISITALLIMSVSWHNYKNKAAEIAAELNAYKLYENSFKNLIDEIRIKQHDFNNHISTIYNQHKLYNTYEELVEHQRIYCDDIVNDNKYTSLLKAGDSAIIGFLYGKFIEAEKKGIVVEYRVNIMTLQIDVPTFKIIEVLGNLINNAIDELQQSIDKKLYVNICEDNEKFVMSVGNTGEYISTEQFQMFFKKGFSKKNANRGMGLYSVKKASNTYGFDILCSNDIVDGRNVVKFEIQINKAATPNR